MIVPLIEIRAPGIPVPQGSKVPQLNRLTGKPFLRDDNDHALRPWRNTIATAAMASTTIRKLDGPLVAHLLFRFPPVDSRWRRADRERGWMWKDVKPDQDKLQRAVFDALTQNIDVLADDARIVDARVQKIETTAWTGVCIRIWRAEYDEEN